MTEETMLEQTAPTGASSSESRSMSQEPTFPQTAPPADIEAMLADAHGYFREHRESLPVVQNGPVYYLLRSRDILPIINNPKSLVPDGGMAFQSRDQPGGMEAFGKILGNGMGFSNGAVQARRRAPVSRSLARTMMEKMRPNIRAEARALASGLPRGEPFDFLECFARQFPTRIVIGLLGLDPVRWPYFSDLASTILEVNTVPVPAAAWENIERASAEILDLLAVAVKRVRENPRDDFISNNVQAWDEAGVLSELEIISQLSAVLTGGIDTTKSGLCYQQMVLLEDRERWQTLLDDPTLVISAMNECLRYEPPVGSSVRLAPPDLVVDGISIPEGSLLQLMLMSAMRDPESYADPDRFDIRRSDGPRLLPLFGGGVHRCVGEMLARVELEEALLALLDIAPTIRLAAKPEQPRGFAGLRLPGPLMLQID